MKKTVIYLLGSVNFVYAQVKEEVIPTTATKVQCEYLGISAPVYTLGDPSVDFAIHTNHEGDVKANRKRPEAVNADALPIGEDPALQKEYGMYPEKAALVSWNGLGGGGPPDPSGAAGPNHYVQAINTKYKVWSKTGVSAMTTANLSTLWAGSTNSGDPIVLYDRHADRWVITQFQTTVNKILIAISTTPSPIGTFYTYSFTFPSFPDYPKFSVWSDGYYMTSNTSTKNVVAFERDKMLVGDATASMVALNLPSMATAYGFRSVLPADADGALPPAGTPNYLFYFQDDSWGGSPGDQIRVLKMTTNYVTPTSSSITAVQTLIPTAFNSVFTNSWDDITQQGTTQKLDAIASVFTFRAQYMRWVGYNTVMLCKVVDVDGNNKGGIRWYQLRQNDATGVWSIFDQGTYSPDANSRFVGSIALDNQGNVGLAYSVSGPTKFPSVGFTGRLNSDPAGQMTFAETVVQAGATFQSGFNRFGDYSQLTLDPNGRTFWFTGEYIGSGGALMTKIFSFDFQGPAGLDDNPYYGSDFIVSQENGSIQAMVNNANYEDNIQFDLYDVSGRLLESIKTTVVNKVSKVVFTASNLVSGTYLVRVGNDKFQRVEKTIIQ